MGDVFLSYKSDDRPFATRVAEGLIAEGVSVWWDPKLRGGETYDQIIEERLRAAKCAVVLWSAKSAASRWVRAEATVADRRKTLLPVMIESCDRPLSFELVQSEDLIGWKGDRADPRWQKFVARVREKVAEGAAAPTANASATMEAAYWDELKESGGAAEDYQAYLKRFPEGGHSAAVEHALKELVADNKKRRRTLNMALALAAVAVVAGGAGGFWYLQNQTRTIVTQTSTPQPEIIRLTPPDMVGSWVAEDTTCDRADLMWQISIEGDNQSAATLVWRQGESVQREQVAEVLDDGAVKTIGAPREGETTPRNYFYTLLPDGLMEASFRDGVWPAWRYRRCG